MNHKAKLLVLLSPFVTWGALFLAFRFGGLSLAKLLPWVNFLIVAALVAWAVLTILDSPYADAHMGVVYALWLAVWWVARRSKAQG